MNFRCRALFGLFLAASLSRCAGSGVAHHDSVLMRSSGVGTDARPRKTSDVRSPNASEDLGRQLLVLPWPNGVANTVPGGVAAHGPYRFADVKYPANLGATNILSQQQALEKAHLAQGYMNEVTRPLTVERVKLKRFGHADVIASGTFKMLTTSSDRQVYEITASFTGPYQNRGNTFGSGTHVFVVDAATGDVLFSTIHAPMLRSSYLDAIHKSHAPPPGALLPQSGVAPMTAATTAPPHYR